jgi:hypothetical protein
VQSPIPKFPKLTRSASLQGGALHSVPSQRLTLKREPAPFVPSRVQHGGAAVGWASRPIDENLPNSRRRRRRDMEPVKPLEGGRSYPRLTISLNAGT